MLRYTASADIGVIPIVGSCLSYVYAAPNKLFEDMMVGVPVVASDLPDMAAVVTAERVGTLITDPTDSTSIATAVRSLLDGDEPLSAIGARARAAALARHNWTIEAPRLIAVYKRVCPRLGDMRAEA
jgi:glycosyltransferase involved in cell wall biosynthesis